MREIKFRGMCIEERVWVAGHLIVIPDHHLFPDSGTYIQTEDKATRVDPETVGQFIGLRDCEENKIYEGDIIEWPSGKQKASVIWDNHSCAFRLREDDVRYSYAIKFLLDARCLAKIVGNIHQQDSEEKKQ